MPSAVARTQGIADAGRDGVRVTIDVDGYAVELENRLGEDGQLVASSFLRWGDPDRTGTWSVHRFGVEIVGSRTFDGVTIPNRGRAGWHFGTDRWEKGVFFRYEITDYALIRD